MFPRLGFCIPRRTRSGVEDASASIPLAYDFEDANGGADTNVLITSAKDDQPSDVKYTFLTDVRELDKEKNQCIRQKNWSTEHSKGNKTVPGKVATTCTKDGHKQTTKTNTTI